MRISSPSSKQSNVGRIMRVAVARSKTSIFYLSIIGVLIVTLGLSTVFRVVNVPNLNSDNNNHSNKLKPKYSSSSKKKESTCKDKDKDKDNDQIPTVLATDIIYEGRTSFVIPEYKLIFFTFPKVACSEWKRMFMRMNGNPNWCKTSNFNAHDPKLNKIKTLRDYEPEIATAMMTSPKWKRAAIVREPKERVLSSFLDKAVKGDYYVKKCCNNLPTDALKEECKEKEEDFSSFLHFVTEYPKECFDVHWEPQALKIDDKWWPYINWIGHQENLLHDSKEILKQLTSDRDEEKNRSALERYGISGWGAEQGCEDRPHGFLEENTSMHKLETGKKLLEWYTVETEKTVEEKWAVEWRQENANFTTIKLFEEKE